MPTGIVKWFDPHKGFGFIVNEKGVDVFVHYTNIESQGFRCLKSGQIVQYRQEQTPKGLQGLQVQVLSVNREMTSARDEQELEAAGH